MTAGSVAVLRFNVSGTTTYIDATEDVLVTMSSSAQQSGPPVQTGIEGGTTDFYALLPASSEPLYGIPSGIAYLGSSRNQVCVCVGGGAVGRLIYIVLNMCFFLSVCSRF
jgi:hypothetical protein